MDRPEDIKTIIHQPSLLRFECYDDYQRLADAIRAHCAPRDILEEMWTQEIIAGEWESAQLRRYKDQIVASAKPAALRNLLQQLGVADDEIEDLVRGWFTNKSVRKRVSSMLRNIGLDEVAIDVEAYRLSMQDLGPIERR